MTLAKQTKNTIEQECPACFSLYAGYGMKAGQYVRFPQGVQLHEKRNGKGRVIKAVYVYADNTKLCYSYSERSETYKLITQ